MASPCFKRGLAHRHRNKVDIEHHRSRTRIAIVQCIHAESIAHALSLPNAIVAPPGIAVVFETIFTIELDHIVAKKREATNTLETCALGANGFISKIDRILLFKIVLTAKAGPKFGVKAIFSKSDHHAATSCIATTIGRERL